jgi:pimeloyl-ACP methyl ester carboxylesterase
MPKVKLRDVELYYETSGDGEALVLVPGFASGSWSWYKQVEDLSRYFRVVTFDPRGVANSVIAPDVPVSISLIADDVVNLLDALKIERAHIMGVSFGGFVAQEFAIRFPQRLGKLILACTSFGGSRHVLPSQDVLAAFASTRGLNSKERIRQYLTTAFLPDFVRANTGEVDRFCGLREKNAVPENVYLQQLESATAFDLYSDVSNIAAETLVISGDKDSVVPFQNSVNLAAEIPNARLEIIEDAGHMVFVEKAVKFNEIVRAFLAE